MIDKNSFIVTQHESLPGKGITIELLEFDQLKGSSDLDVANKIFLANQAHIKLKMIKITLDKGEVVLEPGALYFMRGDLQLESSCTNGGIATGMMRKFMSGETLFQTKISGTGDIYLEPTFGYYIIINIDDDALIFDKGSYWCSSTGIKVGAKAQKNISSALFGGEGFFQSEAKGTGIVVLNSPVPESELMVFELANNEKLSIDGNFALCRTQDVTFKAEKSAKNLLSSITSGEGLLQTFTGPGMVWIAPTQCVYERMSGLNATSNINQQSTNMNNK